MAKSIVFVTDETYVSCFVTSTTFCRKIRLRRAPVYWFSLLSVNFINRSIQMENIRNTYMGLDRMSVITSESVPAPGSFYISKQLASSICHVEDLRTYYFRYTQNKEGNKVNSDLCQQTGSVIKRLPLFDNCRLPRRIDRWWKTWDCAPRAPNNSFFSELMEFLKPLCSELMGARLPGLRRPQTQNTPWSWSRQPMSSLSGLCWQLGIADAPCVGTPCSQQQSLSELGSSWGVLYLGLPSKWPLF